MNSKPLTRKASKALHPTDIQVKRRNTLHQEHINFDKIKNDHEEFLKNTEQIKLQTNIPSKKKQKVKSSKAWKESEDMYVGES